MTSTIKPASLRRLALAGVAAAALALPATAGAADVPATQLSFVGSWSGLSLHKNFEKPFWSETLSKDSNGAVETQVTTFDQMGLAGAEVYRLLSRGVFTIGATVADYSIEDAPEIEGLDMPMIAPGVPDARKLVEAYRPVLNEAFGKRFNAEILAIVPYPSQIVFCNAPISGLSDLKGKKVRASGRTTAEFLNALGAEGITLAFSEVPAALQRKVVDCAVTGSLSGYSSGWHEVSTHLLPMPLGGWDYVVTAANKDKWAEIDPVAQAFVKRELATKFEAPVWDAAMGETVEGIACLTGKGTCGRGPAGKMTLVQVTDADRELARGILTDIILPGWASRVDPEVVTAWNETAGAASGLTAVAK
ncbi:TRAP transporter substrate-binding protein [Tistrella sp. BH-R2-4]|uniref:TRAP transporter substrate-binding protein n=1 Tax=Tistrella arctica TaxID=3133430 RepID=A0ABU9YDM2_9PROT